VPQCKAGRSGAELAEKVEAALTKLLAYLQRTTGTCLLGSLALQCGADIHFHPDSCAVCSAVPLKLAVARFVSLVTENAARRSFPSDDYFSLPLAECNDETT